MTHRSLWRAAFLVPAGIAFLAGLDAALLLLGVGAPVSLSRFAQVHGYLMTLGFVGTLISLERAVALKRWWGYISPAAMGAGGVLLLSPVPLKTAFVVCLVGIAAMCINYVPLWRRNRDIAVLIQILGSAVALIATLLLVAGVPIRALVSWLAIFLVLTIFGERLELARLALQPRDATTLLTLSCCLTLALPLALMWPTFGYPLLGMSLLVSTLWLGTRDVARRLISTSGARRFMAACMLAGYVWLAVAAVLWMAGPAFSGVRYDAVIHAVFLGFTMSMIMAHASTILPAVLRVTLPYRSVMWVPAALLHVSLVIRVWLGDVLDVSRAVQVGGVLNVIALLGFFVVAAGSSILATRDQRRTPRRPKLSTQPDGSRPSASQDVPR